MINQRPYVGIWISLMMLAVTIISCFTTFAPFEELYATNLGKAEKKQITITSDSSPSYGPAYIAKEMGILDGLDFPVRIVMNNRSFESESMYLNNAADGILEDFGDTVLRNSLSNRSDIHSRVVYVVSQSTTDDILVGKNVTDVTGLYGLKIGYGIEKASSKLFVKEVLKKYNVPEDAVTLVPLPADRVLDSLEISSIDAGHVKRSKQPEGLPNGVGILATGIDVPGIITSVLSFRTSTVVDRADDIRSIVDAFLEGNKILNSRSTDVMSVLNNTFGSEYPDIERTLQGFYFLNRTENTLAMESENKSSLHQIGKKFGDIYLEEGDIRNLSNISRMIKNDAVQQT